MQQAVRRTMDKFLVWEEALSEMGWALADLMAKQRNNFFLFNTCVCVCVGVHSRVEVR